MRYFFKLFEVSGAVLLFVCAVAIFLNIAGFTIAGGEVKKMADISLCKLAISNCVSTKNSGPASCEDICLPCTGEWYEKCLKGDLSLFT